MQDIFLVNCYVKVFNWRHRKTLTPTWKTSILKKRRNDNILLNIILRIHFNRNSFYDKYFFFKWKRYMISWIFKHFTLHLRFTTVMRNTLRRGRRILNPRPTLNQCHNQLCIWVINRNFWVRVINHPERRITLRRVNRVNSLMCVWMFVIWI